MSHISKCKTVVGAEFWKCCQLPWCLKWILSYKCLEVISLSKLGWLIYFIFIFWTGNEPGTKHKLDLCLTEKRCELQTVTAVYLYFLMGVSPCLHLLWVQLMAHLTVLSSSASALFWLEALHSGTNGRWDVFSLYLFKEQKSASEKMIMGVLLIVLHQSCAAAPYCFSDDLVSLHLWFGSV